MPQDFSGLLPDSLIEGLFGGVVVVGFFFWIVARMRKKSVAEQYDEMMNRIMGYTTESIAPDNSILNKLKERRTLK